MTHTDPMTHTDGTTDWYGPETATFGDRLTGAREASGLSPEDFAHRLGVRLKTVHAWEGDIVDPRANRLTMMAGMLGVSIRWLLTGEGEGIVAPDSPPKKDRAMHTELTLLRTRAAALARDLGRLEKRMLADAGE